MPVSKQLHASRHGVRIDHRSLIVMSSVPLSLTAPNYATRPIAAGELLTEHPSLDEDFCHVIQNLHVCGSLPDICALPKDDVGLLASVFSQARHFDEAFHQIPVGSSSVDAQDRNFELL